MKTKLLLFILFAVLVCCKNKTNSNEHADNTTQTSTKQKQYSDGIDKDSVNVEKKRKQNIMKGDIKGNYIVLYKAPIIFKDNSCQFVFYRQKQDMTNFPSALFVCIVTSTNDTLYKKQFAYGGNYGGDPNYRIIKKTKNNCEILLEYGYTQMGITSVNIGLYTFINKEYSEILKIKDASYDNSDEPRNDNKFESYTTKLEFKKDDSEFCRIDAIVTGKKLNKQTNQVEPINEKEIYEFDKIDNVYKIIKTEKLN
jgi:hypothetical protein